MERKLILISVMVILFTSLLITAFRVSKVQASSTIYIRADGSIDPPTANITSADNVTYTFIGNINESIVLERNNTVVDGAGYMLQGSGSGNGFDCSGINNVTIKHTNIKNFYYGIDLSFSSNYNSISGNNITNNGNGIRLGSSSNNSISGNNITANNGYGIWLSFSSNNSIQGNTFIDDGLYVTGSYQNSVENNTMNGKPLIYLEGMSNYTVDDDAGQVILVRCDNIKVVSLNLSRTTFGIELWETSNSTISGNNITNNGFGILLSSSSNYNSISGNNITANNRDGIYLSFSSNNSIQGNNITANNDDGICLGFSSNNSIKRNTITNNGNGIHLHYSSNNSIKRNTITNNLYGIRFSSSSNNSISGNTITNSWYDIVLDVYSSSNRVFHNNLINNTNQVFSRDSVNIWDDGYPSGGNYWSNYSGVDSDFDGIGDSQHVIDENNHDNYPLMGMFSNFNATSEHYVQTICNSAISDFQHNGTAISFDVTGENGTSGFCRICIPKALMNETYRVFVNGTEILPSPELLPFSNSTHSFLYFTYDLSTKEVVIIPEFPSLIILPLFMITCLAVSLIRKRLHKGVIHPHL